MDKTQEKKEWVDKASCLDSAFEREAMLAGLVKWPVFPENQQYLESLKSKEGTDE